MTVLDRPPVAAESTPPAPSASPAAPAARPPRRAAEIATRVGLTLCLLAALLLGFLVYLFGVSHIQAQRTQNTMYKTVRDQLARGVAPTAPTRNGRPVAVLDIPRLGLAKAVVIEGTRPEDLMNGPGHRTDTPLPGQPGVSVVDGKHGTFGAPFAHLTRLRRGDLIRVTTAYGPAKYRVMAIGDDRHPPRLTTLDRLMLVTTNSSYIPTRTVIVAAVLVGNPLPSGTVSYPAAPPLSEQNLAIDTRALQPLMLWGAALVIASAVMTVAAHRWARWPAYLAFAPVVLAVVWNVYENAAALLPNLY